MKSDSKTLSKKVFAALRDLNVDGKVVLGCSGGRDSMCLLDILVSEGLKPIIAHVQYAIREGSKKEADYLPKYCDKHDLPFEFTKSSLTKNEPNIESRARNIRYAFFEDVRKKHRATFILTAHHLNDSLETALLNFTRSTGIKGLRGIQQKRDHIVRPLINCTRAEINQYIKDKKLTYFEDETNTSLQYKRNVIRHKVIPALQEINPEVVQSFESTKQHLGELEHFLKETVHKWINEHLKNNSFSTEAFQKAPRIVQKEILMQLFKKIYQNTEMLRQQHLEQILSLLHNGKNGTEKSFGSTKKLTIQKNSVTIAPCTK